MKTLKCEYCGSRININDKVCSSCGANVSNVVDEYLKENEEKAQKVTDEVINTFKVNSKFVLIPAVFIILVITTMTIIFFINFTSHRKVVDNIINETSTEIKETINNSETSEETVAKNLNGGLNEEVYNGILSIKIDSYEFYEYKDTMGTGFYNTKKGYQKIAFHTVIKNISTKDISIYSWNMFTLQADNAVVDDANLELPTFYEVVSGQEKYAELKSMTLPSDSTLEGYIGYEVPTSAQTLKFTVNGMTIEFPNPCYNN